MIKENDLSLNLDKLHKTKLGVERVKQNHELETDDIVKWCRQAISQSEEITTMGKNWYVHTDDAVITINAAVTPLSPLIG